MSTQNLEKPEVTKEYLEGINYNDLKATFEELGIAHVFIGGAKKDKLISSALKTLSEIKEAQGLPKDEAVIEIELEEKELESQTDIVVDTTEEENIDIVLSSDKEVEDIRVKDEDYVTAELNVSGVVTKVLDPNAGIEEGDVIEFEEECPYSKEVLEKSLKNIEANLQNNLPTQRIGLLKKKQEILDMMEKFYS